MIIDAGIGGEGGLKVRTKTKQRDWKVWNKQE